METANDSWPIAAATWVVESEQPQIPPTLTEALSEATPGELGEMLELLLQRLDELPQPDSMSIDQSDIEAELTAAESGESPAQIVSRAAIQAALLRLRQLLQLAAARTLRLRLESDHPEELEPIVSPELLAELADELLAISPTSAAHCLQILAAQGDTESLATLCELLKHEAFEDDRSLAVALSPLFQWPPPALASIYEVLGEDVWRWQLLGALLDLAGHALRKGKLKLHPLAEHSKRLRELLSATVGRLAKLEENPAQFGSDVASVHRVLHNAISLTVSLCDTLGLMSDLQAEGQLNQALDLAHRRIQTEAAFALARLGKEHGRQRLVELAADPASRLRAVAYADELSIDVPELAGWREPAAIAEAEVVSWLAHSDRFGVPPAELELVDDRSQYWPSYDEPQHCWLYRFTYHFTQGSLSNFIIAGPLVFAFQADLRSLELDDVYATFAGWQAEHDDIFEVPLAKFNSAQRNEAERLLDTPSHEGIEGLQTLALTFFFGERAILAIGTRGGVQVCTVSDGLETLTVPIDQRPTSLTPDLVLAMYRGRKLLRSFNS